MDELADYSNYGKCVDFLAPGSAILTASHEDDDSEVHVSGTSLAAAHAAGNAALLLGSEKAEGTPARVDIYMYLGSYYEAQIDIREGSVQDKITHNRLIYVREATIAPTLERKEETCYGCQYSLSGCACEKDWSYPYDGGTHKCDGYCCDPYGDKDAPQGYCQTKNKCTVRVAGEAPRRQNTDKCDTVPGRRLSGGWLDKPHVYEASTIFHPPTPEPEDECVAVTVPTTTTTTTAGPANPAVTTPTTRPADPVGPANPARPAVDLTGTPDPKDLVSEIQKDLDCLTKRLSGEPCP